MTPQDENRSSSILLVLGGGIIGYEVFVFWYSVASGADFVLFVLAIFMIIGLIAKQEIDNKDESE